MRSIITILILCCSLGLSTSALAKTDKAPCTVDPKLNKLAGYLLLRERVPTPDELIEDARVAGVDATRLYSRLDVWSSPTFGSWLRKVHKQADAPLYCGRARKDDQMMMVVAVVAGVLRPSKKGEYLVWLDPSFSKAQVMLRDRNGRTTQEEVKMGSRVRVPADFERPVLVQLSATGPLGPRPIAQRWLGTPNRPSSRTVHATSVPEWVKLLREEAKAAPLRHNRLIDQEANAHAAAICKSGQIGHSLPNAPDPQQRLAKRGLEARVVGEVVARGASVTEALDALTRSPSHRLTLIDQRFTDYGFGAAKAEDERECVVVMLAAWPKRTH